MDKSGNKFLIFCFVFCFCSIVSAQYDSTRGNTSKGEKRLGKQNLPLDSSVELKPDLEAGFAPGSAGLSKYFQDSFVAPPGCHDSANTKNSVLLRLTIDTNGVVVKAEVIKKFGNCTGFANEAIRLIKSSHDWFPARMKDGRKVKSYLSVPITLVL